MLSSRVHQSVNANQLPIENVVFEAASVPDSNKNLKNIDKKSLYIVRFFAFGDDWVFEPKKIKLKKVPIRPDGILSPDGQRLPL